MPVEEGDLRLLYPFLCFGKELAEPGFEGFIERKRRRLCFEEVQGVRVREVGGVKFSVHNRELYQNAPQSPYRTCGEPGQGIRPRKRDLTPSFRREPIRRRG